jgi:type VI secretion system protein ImpK
MNEQFSRLVEPIIRYMINIQRRLVGPGTGHPSLDEVHDELVRLFKESRSSAASYERPRDYTDLAEYALVYWADEVLINSDWAHADEWRGNRLLEWELYQENVAGDKFFTKAEVARAQSRDALETFFVCVALGFQGRYATDKARRPRWRGSGMAHPQLREWATEAYRLIRETQERLFPREDADFDSDPAPLPGRTLLLRVSILISITVLSTLAAWIGIYYLGS